MVEALPLEFEQNAERLLIHFDVVDHYLDLDTFIQTAKSARKIVDALDKSCFKGSLDYKLVVLPPTSGTFLAELALWVGAGGASVFAFISSDPGAAFVEGLTGKTPSDWGKIAGQNIRKRASQSDNKNVLIAKSEILDPSPSTLEPEPSHVASLIVIEMTRAVLEISPADLLKIGMDRGDLPEALDARADFYTACIADPKVKSIGFTSTDDFPIPRSAFPERAMKVARKKEEEEEPIWLISDESIYVNSPNWSQDKQKARMWQGIDSMRKECLFVIEDAEFWGRIRRKELHFEGLNSLKVQWACQLVEGRQKNRRVLRVLEFKGVRSAEPLSDDSVKAILGDFGRLDANYDEASLFDYGEKQQDNRKYIR